MRTSSAASAFKRFFTLPGESQPEDLFYLLLLSLCYGSYFLLLTIALYMPGGVVTAEQFLIYVQGWLTVPLLTALAVIGAWNFKARFFAEDANFYPLYAAVCVLTTLLGGFGLSLSWQAFHSLSLAMIGVVLVILIFPIAQVFALVLIRRYRSWLADRVRPAHVLLLKRLIPFALGLYLLNFCSIFTAYPDYQVSLRTVFLAIICGAVLRFNTGLFNLPAKRAITILIDLLAAVGIVLACFDPHFTVAIHSQDFFLGPVNALLHGKTMLVDVYSQYGVFLLEFLAAIIGVGHLPLTYPLFSAIVALLSMLQFGFLYGMMRIIFRSIGYAVLGLCLVLLLNVFASIYVYQSYPSVGPLRFGLGYLLVGLVLLRLKFPRCGRWLAGLELAVFGLASIWSFETFVYVATVFVASRVYQTLLERLTLRRFAMRLLVRLGWALLSVFLFQVAQALYIYFRAGQWPNWGIYLNYLLKYSVDGFSAMPVDPWSPWFFLVMIYFVSLLSVGLRGLANRRLDGSADTQTLLNLSFMGIVQLTYFTGRSSPNNLFNICVPAVIIALYGVRQVRRLEGAEFRAFALPLAVGLSLILLQFLPAFLDKLPETAFPTVQTWFDAGAQAPAQMRAFAEQEYQAVASHHPSTDQAQDAINLIQKYAAQQPRVAVFISPVESTEALILSKKGQVYPINDPIEDSLSPQVVKIILDAPETLHPGDTIFLATDPHELSLEKVNGFCALWAGTPNACIEIQQKVVAQLCGSYGFDEIERSPNGVSAMRLTPPGSGGSDYCTRLNSIPWPSG